MDTGGGGHHCQLKWLLKWAHNSLRCKKLMTYGIAADNQTTHGPDVVSLLLMATGRAGTAVLVHLWLRLHMPRKCLVLWNFYSTVKLVFNRQKLNFCIYTEYFFSSVRCPLGSRAAPSDFKWQMQTPLSQSSHWLDLLLCSHATAHIFPWSKGSLFQKTLKAPVWLGYYISNI